MLLVFCLGVLALEFVESQSFDKVCILEDGRTGVCIPFGECEYAINLIKKRGQRPEHCSGFVGRDPIVCCPRVISEIICRKYYKNDYFTVVFGGTEAKPREFKHMAAIGYGEKENIKWLCGGTVLSERVVLTAAHCVESKDWGSAKWVRLGDLDLMSTTDDAKPQDFAISESFIHPDYKRGSHYHDIAVLKLDKKAKFDDYVKPACLDIADSPPKELSVTGWGKTDFLGDSSSHLLKASVFLIDNKECSKVYSSLSGTALRNGLVESQQICAGHPDGQDTCPGDSGGPLQYQYLDRFMIVGVTSFGKACGVENSAGVYTRISYYRHWIEDTAF